MNARRVSLIAVSIALVTIMVYAIRVPVPATGGFWHTGVIAETFLATAFGPATLHAGDLTIRASAVPTSTLAVSVADQYGIQRGDDTVLLLVALRQGPEGREESVPAQVSVTVTDLSGQRQDVPMRQLRSGDLLDYVGTLDVSAPDTLRFDLRIVREGGEVSNMQFTREFHPR